MSDSNKVKPDYETKIDEAIQFSIFLQSIPKYENGIIEKIKETKIEVEVNNIKLIGDKKITKPLSGQGHLQRIATLDWDTELSEEMKEGINTSAFQELTEYDWKDRGHIKSAITYLNEQLEKNSSINKFYKKVLMFIFTNEKDSNFNESVFKKVKSIFSPLGKKGGKSRRRRVRRRKTNKKKTRKAKKKTNKKKRKGNKKRKTRARTRRKH